MTSTFRPSIVPLLAINFVGTLGFSIVTPFLVVLVTQWGGNAIVYGIVAATYSFFQLFGAPVLGRMSDRIGRRRVLLISQGGTLLSWAIFLLAFFLPDAPLFAVENAWLGSFAVTLPLIVLFVARAADGLTGGNVSVSNAYLADISTDDTRTKNFGQMAVSTNLGFIVGPALAGLLGATALGSILPVLAAFGISAIALVMIQVGLHDAQPDAIEEKLERPSACDLFGHEHRAAYDIDTPAPIGLRQVLGRPNMPALLSVNFLVMLGFSFFYVAFPVHAVSGLGWDVTAMGVYFAVLSGAMILVQGPILAWASGQWSERQLMSLGGLALAGGFALLLRSDLVAIYGAAGLIALGNGLMWPTFMAVLSKASGTEMQGTVQGYAQSGGAVASIAGMVLGGVLYIPLGSGLFTLSAVIILVAAGLALAYRPPQAPNAPAPA